MRFAASWVAIHLEGSSVDVRHAVGVIDAASETQATERALAKAKEICLEKNGWSHHKAAVTEIR